MSTEATEALIERVLAEHVDMTDRSADDGCSCGHPDPRTYEAHVAAAITQALADTANTHDDYDWPDHAASAIRALYDTDSGRLDNWSER